MDKILCENFYKRGHQLLAGKYVSLCFDDFPKSAAQVGAPMLEAYGWRATWYVSGGFMGQTEPIYGRMFEAGDLTHLRQSGHDFGSHTFDHIDCRTATSEEIDQQCRRNDAFLATHGISDVQSFAFPFGAANLASKRHLAASAMALRGVKPGVQRGTVDLNMLKACGLQDDQGGTARALQELEALKQTDGWLILFTHDLRAKPSPWGVTPEAYQALLRAIERSGAEVVTVGEMVSRLSDAADVKKRSDLAA